MKVLGTVISRERLAGLILILLMNVTMIAARAIYLQRVPLWVYLLDGFFVVASIFVLLLDYRRQKTHRQSAERL